MSLATLTSKDLSRIQKLIERKETLSKEIATINSELEAFDSDTPQASLVPPPARHPTAGPKSSPPAKPIIRKESQIRSVGRGSLKERISAKLKSAGKPGMKVQDLATELGTTYGNITNFFQNTGKKMKEIKKVAPGRFAWVDV